MKTRKIPNACTLGEGRHDHLQKLKAKFLVHCFELFYKSFHELVTCAKNKLFTMKSAQGF